MIALLIVILILTAFSYHWLKLKRRREKLKWLTKVPGKPLVGIAFQFSALTEILKELHKNVQKYGRIHTFEIGIDSFILVSDYEHLEYFLSSPTIITKSRQYDFLINWLNNGLLMSTGKKWKIRRKILTPSFHFSILEQFLSVFHSASDVLIKRLEEEEDKEIDIYPYVNLCALDIICEGIMGVSVNAQENKDSEYVKAVREMSRIITARGFSALESYDIFYPLFRDYYIEKRCVKILHDASDAVIKARRNILEKKMEDDKTKTEEVYSSKKTAFLDLLLTSTVEGKPLSDRDIREEVDTFMFEGHDTTSSGTGFTLYCLANHLDVQQKVFEEQRRIFGENKNPEVTSANLQDMKYLEYVIKESMRLFPPVPLIARKVTQDITLKDGNVIPESVNIMISPYCVQRDPEYFPDPTKFDPERFERSDGALPYAYIPFSAGPRNCIGQKFAMLEMKSILSKIVRNFEILPTIPKHEAILSVETILKAKNGIRVRVKKRQ